MIISVEVACQKPTAVDLNAVVAEFPYGAVKVIAMPGGLDIPNAHKSDAHPAIIAHAAIKVALDLDPKEQ